MIVSVRCLVQEIKFIVNTSPLERCLRNFTSSPSGGILYTAIRVSTFLRQSTIFIVCEWKKELFIVCEWKIFWAKLTGDRQFGDKRPAVSVEMIYNEIHACCTSRYCTGTGTAVPMRCEVLLSGKTCRGLTWAYSMSLCLLSIWNDGTYSDVVPDVTSVT